jgi:hypothetical protein
VKSYWSAASRLSSAPADAIVRLGLLSAQNRSPVAGSKPVRHQAVPASPKTVSEVRLKNSGRYG